MLRLSCMGRVSFLLGPEELSIWDTKAHAWSEVSGQFKVRLGSSSRDIRVDGTLANRARA